MFDRREFLRRGIALGLAPALLPLAGEAAPAEPPRVRRRARLGNTGLELPDIGFGSFTLNGDVALVQHALARGISYFDTAESYENGAAEETLGRALAGRRSEVLLASKVVAGARATRAELFAALDGSLRRLRTDHVDVYFNHAVNALDRIQNPEWPEFTSRAKQQGKLRFSGMSGHGAQLVACLDYALDHQLVDVVLTAYNFGQDPAFYERFGDRFDMVARQPDLPRVLRRARAQGVGCIAMKTQNGGKLNDLRAYEGAGASFSQAALRWTLAGGLVDAAIIGMANREQVDEYLGASGWTAPHPADAGLLTRHVRARYTEQCRYGCGDCAGACPHGVSIPDVLRARMYAEDYGLPAQARAALAEVGGASACLRCDGSPCRSACPHGVAIPTLTARIARLA